MRDGRVSLMFMVAGSNTVLRLNCRAQMSAKPSLIASFEAGGKHPRTVIVMPVGEVCRQCARAVMRAGR